MAAFVHRVQVDGEEMGFSTAAKTYVIWKKWQLSSIGIIFVHG